MRKLPIAPLIRPNFLWLKNNRAILSWNWLKPQLPVFSQQTRLFIITFSKQNWFELTSPLVCYFEFQRPCPLAASLQMQISKKKKKVIDVTLWGSALITSPSIFRRVWWTLCERTYSRSWDVNKVLFVTFHFLQCPFCLTDLRLFLSEHVGFFFFVSFQERKKAALSPPINKHLCE